MQFMEAIRHSQDFGREFVKNSWLIVVNEGVASKVSKMVGKILTLNMPSS